MGYTLLLFVAALLQAPAPQNPSPMTETTRPHPRVAPYDAPGQRIPLGQGSLFLRRNITPASRVPLIVHFHGAPWLIEHHVARLKDDAALVTFQLGAGSGVYAKPFADATAFASVLAAATRSVSAAFERSVTFDPIVLTSWSAGYGAIRAILRQPEHYSRISSVVLLDSMHASYAGIAPAGPRAEDLPVAAADVDAFVTFADDAAAGRKQFVILHSEVFPGTYASTTETADAILRHAGLRRRPVLEEGPIGMQQLSETVKGRLVVIGYAGNAAPDHTDHLYALADVLTRWRVMRR